MADPDHDMTEQKQPSAVTFALEHLQESHLTLPRTLKEDMV